MKNIIYRTLSSLSEKTELPLTDICREFAIHTTGRREVIIEGADNLKKYETNEIIIGVCGGYISVFGNGLEIKSFQKYSLCIRGDINRIEFGEGGQK
ncbi:MAG: YabP/YqfC family sporulation protein [Clostridia bacterium]|nr:YabP/YqfC family sporulation protein [Clostridia bacterium]